MKKISLVAALLLTLPGLALAADYGKLIDAVDTEKAADSIDVDKMKEALTD